MNQIVMIGGTLALLAWVLRPLLARESAIALGPPRCPTHGVRPEGDARFCSTCGKPTTR